MATIFHQVIIAAPLPVVYQNISLQEGLSQWWIADTTAKPEVGYVNEFRMEEHGTNRMKIISLEANKRVLWECINENDGWTGTLISFELSERIGYTCLNFKHSGYQDQDDLYATCNYHWARHLFMLKHLCETGTSLLQAETEAKERAAVHG